MKLSKETQQALEEQGWDSLESYLTCLAEDNGLRLYDVKLLADLYGPDEYFDGLVAACEDMSRVNY